MMRTITYFLVPVLVLFAALKLFERYLLRPPTFDLAVNAISKNELDTVKTLLNEIEVNARGTDPNPMISGMTLLMYAAQSGSFKMVDLLLDHGADPAIQRGDGTAAIHLAVRLPTNSPSEKQDVMSIIETLAGYENTLNLRSGNAETPLYIAVGYEVDSKFEKAAILLKRGADPNYRSSVTKLSILELAKDNPKMLEALGRDVRTILYQE